MEITDTLIKIYFDDLKEEPQEALLDDMGLESAEEGNYDVIPIFIVEKGVIR